MQRLLAITHARFSLFRFRSPLLTESRLLSLPVGTEMFHFPTFPPPTLCVQVGVTGLASSRVSPFGNPRITVWLSTPRGLSQIPTSFFGSWCQGIHRVPLKTWPQRCSRPLCSSQHTGGDPIRTGTHTHALAGCGMTRTRPQPATTTNTRASSKRSRPPVTAGGHEGGFRACARPFRTQQRARHRPHPPRPTVHDHPTQRGGEVSTGEPARGAGAN
jgi:hypothetical protein